MHNLQLSLELCPVKSTDTEQKYVISARVTGDG